MASVVAGMSMSEVRKCLQSIRVAWTRHTPWDPFCPSSMLHDTSPTGEEDENSANGQNLSMTHFAWLFVTGHHTKRKRKAGGGGASVA